MLKGKTAFITGGSGALGAEMVRVFAREGCRVHYSFHTNADRAKELDARMKSEGMDVVSHHLDVLDAKEINALAAELAKTTDGIDILVNNAGVTQVMPFALLEESDWDLVMDSNIKGMFLVTKGFIRGMIQRRRGSIVNLGSLAGMRILEVPVHYATAKSAVLGFTLSLAKEMARYGIRVNGVVPGRIEAGVGANVPERLIEEYNRYCLAGRAGKPEEVAETVAFLASDRASYVNAQMIFVDGGI